MFVIKLITYLLMCVKECEKYFPNGFVSSMGFVRRLKFEEMQPNASRNYQRAIETLNRLQTNAQYLNSPNAKPKAFTNIPEVTKFLKRSGLSLEDLDKLRVIHITGTNGKGSTCAYCEKILRSHGFTTGFFSSPHLLDVRERIRINGKPISKDEFARHFWRIYDALDSQKDHAGDMPQYFRYLTLMAFHIFLERKVNVAILEVGIGGEYDCTNVVRNTIVAGITPLDLDHTSILGDNLESIAWNKSGIFKEGCVAFSVKQPESVLEVFRQRSIEKNCTFNVIEKNSFKFENNCDIPMEIQETNANLAIKISEAFMKRITNNNVKFSLETAKNTIEEVTWPGRYQIKEFENIRFFLDGAHTLDSICICRNWFEKSTKEDKKKKCLIFNLTGNRSPNQFFNELSKCQFDTVIFTPNVGQEKKDRADILDFVLTEDTQMKLCDEYKTKWLEINKTEVLVVPSFSKAVEHLTPNGPFNCLVTGSIHLIGAALSIIDPYLNGILCDKETNYNK